LKIPSAIFHFNQQWANGIAALLAIGINLETFKLYISSFPRLPTICRGPWAPHWVILGRRMLGAAATGGGILLHPLGRPAATSVCLPLLREDKEVSLVATVASRAAVCSFMVNCLGRVNVALWAPQLNAASRKVCGKNPLQ